MIRSQFPGLAAKRIARLGNGWDNTAYLVDGAFVFRFPRRSTTVALLEREARVLPKIASFLPLTIPTPEWTGRGERGYPWPFVGYRKLAGRTACVAKLSETDRLAAAGPLGAALAALHAIRAAGLDLPPDTLRRTDFRRRMPLLVERLAVLDAARLIDGPHRWLELFRDAERTEPAVAHAVVHGDLYARHILVDTRNRVRGIIDWGDVHLGDSAVDLSLMFGFLPPAARDAFTRAYGRVDDRTRRAARLRAAFHAVSVTWYAHTVADRALLGEGLRAMRHVLEG